MMLDWSGHFFTIRMQGRLRNGRYRGCGYIRAEFRCVVEDDFSLRWHFWRLFWMTDRCFVSIRFRFWSEKRRPEQMYHKRASKDLLFISHSDVLKFRLQLVDMHSSKIAFSFIVLFFYDFLLDDDFLKRRHAYMVTPLALKLAPPLLPMSPIGTIKANQILTCSWRPVSLRCLSLAAASI